MLQARASVFALVVVLGLSSCSGTQPPPLPPPLAAPGPDAGAPARLAAALRQPCGPGTTTAVIEALARAGIETRDDATNALVQEVVPPALGLHVTRFQARGLGCELANRGGTSGNAIDEMVGPLPLPDDLELPFSALLGAYVSSGGERFGGQLSAALMGQVDATKHATLVYPSLVVLLFSREVVVPMLSEARFKRKRDVRYERQAVAIDPCAAISSFLDDLPSAAENAVGKLAPEEGGFWSSVVSVAARAARVVGYATAEAARTVIRHAPFVDAVRQAAAAAAMAADLKAMFTQWNLTVSAIPATLHKSTGTTNTGQFVLTVTAPGEENVDWPQQVRSCAQLLAIPLPNLGSPDMTSVKWERLAGFQAPATEQSAQTQLSGGMAIFTYSTVTESAAVHAAGGTELSTPARVKANLSLPGLESFGRNISNFGDGILAGAAAPASDLAAALLGPSAPGEATITYHGTPATLDVNVSAGQGMFRMHVVSCGGVDGPYNGMAEVTGDPSGTGTVTPFSFDPVTKQGQLSVMIPLSGMCGGNYNVTGQMTLGGSDTAPTIAINGMVNGMIVCPVGGGPITTPFVGTHPVRLGSASECP